MEIGKRIKEIRLKNKMNQKKFGEFLEKEQSNISAMENESKKITLEDIIKICEKFNVSSDWILFGEARQKNDDYSYLTEEDKQDIDYILNKAKKRNQELTEGDKKEYKTAGNL